MNTDQKFNAVSERTEKYLNTVSPLPKTRVIAEDIARNEGMLYKDFNTVFKYLTGINFMDYIRARRMNLAYEWLLDMEQFKWDYLLDITGYDNESSFSKQFKSLYGTTPKEAYQKKDRSLLKPPLLWADLSSSDAITEKPNLEEDQAMIATFLGIPKNEIALVNRARDLQLLYEFNDEQTDAAYRIAKRYEEPIEKAFDYVEAYCIYWHYNEKNSLMGTFDEETKDHMVEDEEMEYAYCVLGLPISEALSIRDELRDSKYTLLDLDPDILQHAKTSASLPYAKIIECFDAAGPDTDMSLALMAMEYDGLDAEAAVARAEQDMDEMMDMQDDWEEPEDNFDDIAFGDYGEDDDPDPYGPRYKDEDEEKMNDSYYNNEDDDDIM